MSFENIRGVDQWAAALKSLIDEARAASDFESRRKISEQLTEFVIQSMPADESEREAVKKLDDLAAEASEAVLIGEIGARVQAIAARANDLARLQKSFESQAARNAAAARSIRLQNLRTAIETATGMIESLNKVKADLEGDAADAKDVTSKIDRAMKTVQDVRSTLELIGVPI